MRVRVNPVGLVVGLRARSLAWLRFVAEGSLSVVVGATRVHIRVQGAQTGFQVDNADEMKCFGLCRLGTFDGKI